MGKAKVWVEKRCTVEHGGKTFESGGAFISPNMVIAYLGKDGILNDWHGHPIGTYKIKASWRTPRSYLSDRMYQVEAIVDDVVYTGRSAGEGMAFKGKRKKGTE